MTQVKTKNAITFSDFDKLNLKAFAKNLFQLIEKGLDSSIDEIGEKRGLTISLNAVFGNGKTTFLKMFEHFIKIEKKDYDVLFINAWESDFYKEPVIAILSEFANWIESENKKKKENSNKEKNQRTKKKIDKEIKTYEKIKTDIKTTIGRIAKHKITKTAGLAVNQLLQHATGLGSKELINCFSKKDASHNNELLEKLGESAIREFKKRKIAIKEVKESISKYIAVDPKKPKKLLIIIDELDRARPDYAVRFLEDIKHFFDIEDVAFLVAVNRQQMETTVKCLYGQDLYFDGYYRKFFKQEMDLPDPYKEAQKLVNDLIQKIEVTLPNYKRDLENVYLSCKMFGLTLRELEMFVRIFEIILKKKDIGCVHVDCCSFFICLFLKKKDTFKKILNDQLGIDVLREILEEKNITLPLTEEIELGELIESIACSLIKIDFKNENEKHQQIIKLTNKIRNEIIGHELMYPLEKVLSIMHGRKYNFGVFSPSFASKICKSIEQHN